MKPVVTIVFAWIGETDLRCAGVRERRKHDIGDGPIAQAVLLRAFDRVELLCNDGFKREEMDAYVAWLTPQIKSAVRAEHVHLDNPTHHAEVHRAVVDRIERVMKEFEGQPQPRLVFHISPGTPAMHAVWLLLAKSRFGAELIQTSSQNGLETVEVPFEIDAVFIPDYFRRHDEQLAELSAGTSPATAAFDDIKHESRVMKDVIRRAALLAIRSASVLLLGESGTGKELFATAIHNTSPRSGKPLKIVNCGAIPEALVESELFGHKKGAFTGADRDKIGLFEAANGGTVFLDEVGDLPMLAQVKLLRVVQEGVVQAIGDEGKPRKVDVRIIAATHKDLASATAGGRFREDLFYRLAVGVLHLPALRERGAADLNLLIEHLLREVNKKSKAETGGQDKILSLGARKVLRDHPWPGNVRELVNTLTRAVIFAAGTEIKESDAREALLAVPKRTAEDLLGRPIGDGVDLPEMIEQLKKHYIQRALEEAHGNKTKAAKLVGLDHYQTLTNWMKAGGTRT